MGKDKKSNKKKKETKLKKFVAKACKTKCCKKYKKSESKRCGRCPCYDLLKKVA